MKKCSMETPTYICNILGLNINFPYEPFPCQVAYMGKVIQAFNTYTNAILESPTGTGKTISLLCAALAWLFNQKKSATNVSLKIVYATRSHTRISQIVEQIRSTSYHPQIAILGSRDQECIYDRVVDDRSTNNMIKKCRNAVFDEFDSCPFYHCKDIEDAAMYTIDELKQHCRKSGGCPYYISRSEVEKADIVLMPYSYILNKRIKKSLKEHLTDWILIIEEADEINEVCEQAASFDWTINKLRIAIKDLLEFQKLKKAFIEKQKNGLMNSLDDKLKKILESISNDDITYLQNYIEALIHYMSNDLTDSSNIKICNANEILSYIEYTVGITKSNSDKYISISYSVNTVLEFYGETGFSEWYYTIKTLFNHSDSLKHYCLYGRVECDNGIKIETISLRCLNPGIIFNYVIRHLTPKFALLTSNVLSPFEQFESQLEQKFPIQLENTHSIESHQIFAAILNCAVI